ncbi:MAG: GntR family transcriptional regulator [Pseudonocardia sp.]|nr:GntR family transcriptional regulator [Pseudonocardia sp.]
MYAEQRGLGETSWPPERPEARSLVDEAYEQVKHIILAQEASGGSTISEARLTRDLGMSRTPVREALARLATEGYIRPASGRGYIIVKLTAQDLVNVYQVRAVLEGLAAAEAAQRVRRVDLARLEDLYDEMTVARDEGRDKDLASLNSNFHATIAEISGNTYLKSMLDGIRNVFDRYRPAALMVPGRREDAHTEHGDMIEALRRQDGESARELAEQHVRRALATRQAALYAASEEKRKEP